MKNLFKNILVLCLTITLLVTINAQQKRNMESTV
ncbi:Uncharacterised protein [Chryseobacterium carnipullorum]|uniref:Uncharacterized protein n=1 Tax=Chryseobacterium carnipullorum TaxID=1124835 RepID=A0A376DZQ3_CHRCU|nr:Uncharacterised protein [Chryseobacterium carnipullorum]